jgi:5,10-methylenetetrahydromethanopterin reductase
MTAEFWVPMGWVGPEGIAARAQQVESDGWDGMRVFDTQCLQGEAFVMMTASAVATKILKLSIATSNPVTRHPSVAASAIASLARIASGRITYGIGRGDSSLAYIGGAPADVALFERYVEAVRNYLHGNSVDFASIEPWRLTQDISAIELGHAPDGSRLTWLDPLATPPDIEVFATGPKVIAVAGRQADRICLGLGADANRIVWAIDTARAARSDAGLDPASLSISAIVSVGVGDDLVRARRSVSNMVASAARFAIINGSVAGPVTREQETVYRAIGRSYDMHSHGGHGAQVDALTDEFVDSYAVIGPPERCIERIVELSQLGVDSFMLAPPLGDASAEDIRVGYERLVGEVIPGARSAISKRSAPNGTAGSRRR